MPSLKKASKALSQQHKSLQKQQSELKQQLAALHQKKALLNESWQRCDQPMGAPLNALTCWNSNDFSTWVHQVSQLIDQQILDLQNQLNTVNQALQTKRNQSLGVDHLLTKQATQEAEKQARADQQSLLDTLSR